MNHTRDGLVDFITTYVSQLTSIATHEIDVHAPLERYGLDSIGAAGLSGHLSDSFGVELSPDMAYDHPTIAAIADHLLALLPVPARVAA